MSGLRGFGMVISGGVIRHWYAEADGVKRWSHDHTPVEPVLPNITPPDPIAADEAEHGVCAMGDLPELSDSQMAEGHLTEERR